MAKSPFYKVVLQSGNRDVTELITSLNYEDCTEEDDLVTLNVEGAPISIIDENYFDVGQKLDFSFGFIGGLQSNKRTAQITEIDFDYDFSRVNMTVKCRDLGFLMKKMTSRKVYKKRTTVQIAQDLANQFGLKVDVDETLLKQYGNISVGGKTINQFLKELAQKEGSKSGDKTGPVEVYVRGDTLTMRRRDMSQKSKRTYEYQDGNGSIKDISISYEDSDDGASFSTSSSGIDMENGDTFNSNSKSEDNKESNTGVRRFDVDANRLADRQPEPTDSGKTLVIPSNNKDDADKKTGAKQKSSASKIMKVSLKLELDPTIQSGEIITLSGLAQKHSGNWRIYKTTHSVSGGGGETTLECYRNGAKKSSTTTGGNNTGDVNKTQGNKEGNTTGGVRVFDQNSKRLK